MARSAGIDRTEGSHRQSGIEVVAERVLRRVSETERAKDEMKNQVRISLAHAAVHLYVGQTRVIPTILLRLLDINRTMHKYAVAERLDFEGVRDGEDKKMKNQVRISLAYAEIIYVGKRC